MTTTAKPKQHFNIIALGYFGLIDGNKNMIEFVPRSRDMWYFSSANFAFAEQI